MPDHKENVTLEKCLQLFVSYPASLIQHSGGVSSLKSRDEIARESSTKGASDETCLLNALLPILVRPLVKLIRHSDYVSQLRNCL